MHILKITELQEKNTRQISFKDSNLITCVFMFVVPVDDVVDESDDNEEAEGDTENDTENEEDEKDHRSAVILTYTLDITALSVALQNVLPLV